MVTCPYCGTENEPDALECINCTASLSPSVENSTGDQGKSELQDEKEDPVDAQFLEILSKEEQMPEGNNEMIDEESLAASTEEENLEQEKDDNLESEMETSPQGAKLESPNEGEALPETDFSIEEDLFSGSVPSSGSEDQASEEIKSSAFERAEEILKSARMGSKSEEGTSPLHEPVKLFESRKNRSLAIGLEFIGLLGVLGIGWLYAGNVLVGVLALVAFGIWNLIAIALDVITLGIFLCIHIPANVIMIAASVYLIYRYTGDRPAVFE